MKIINLTEIQFDEYSKNHILHTYYQTSAYGNLMINQGYNANYLGFIENNQLIGASLILSKNLTRRFTYAYAPRGFLIDYTNIQHIQEITKALTKTPILENCAFIKIDPPVIDYKRNKDGKIIARAKISSHNNLIQSGYTHFGNNLYFETLKPRWNAILTIKNKDIENLKSTFDKQTRNKINKATKRALEIKQLAPQELEKFYKFVAKKHYRNINYYANMQAAFRENFEIYNVVINTKKYLEAIQKIYADALTKNDELNQRLQSGKTKGTDMRRVLSTKMESDRILSIYSKELKIATNLLGKYPDNLEISTMAIIKSNKRIQMVIEGYNPNFKILYPTFLLKTYIIEKYIKQGYEIFDFNAITGDFTPNNKYKGLNEMKLGFNADVTEYIGEYDLVINKAGYKKYLKFGGENYLKKKIK